MAYSITQTINWAQTFIQYSPLTAGTGSEPAISTANAIIAMITSAPFTWAWNRNEYTGLTLAANTQDYNNVAIADFGFLEKVTLKNAAGDYSFEVKDVYNTNILGVSVSKPAEPKSVSVKMVTYGSNVSLRFLSIPDQAYSAIITYQKLPPIFTSSSLTTNWPIPDQYLDIYNNLFLAEAFSAVEDENQAQRYRMRGVAALLAKSEGLTEMQRSAFLSQFLAREAQLMAYGLRTQQGNQARGV